MHIAPFAVEQWMNEWETRVSLNLAETCIHSLTVGEMLALAGAPDAMDEVRELWLGYGEIPGSLRLRTAIAALHARQSPANVMVAHGTIGANHLVYQALVGVGDRVVSVVPSYQQHTSIPESLGADLVRVELDEASGWRLDMERLAEAVTPGTRLVALTNPNNPTGALLPAEELRAVVEIARVAGAWLLCDEVYRGLAPDSTPSVADLYEKGISTSGMSKAFALAGLRVGWIVAPEEVLRRVEIHRDYTTISVGRIDDLLAAVALEAAPAILGHGRDLLAANVARVAEWVAATPGWSWTAPAAGTTALLRYDLPLSSARLCERLATEASVLFTPGSAFGVEGTVRIGCGCAGDVLQAGLARVAEWSRTACEDSSTPVEPAHGERV
ncbi:aminotransferase class I/II-fold pyridoxal phosphate-dependent enzyme [Wenxinia marina]|uniref:Aminotransferase n=1 Tax=Wenxinia marina DSM 24838 TaxID=1123501 RepID=A0A0D0PG90_9RHOB|nr:aminotransferase class I/II-fold pyridoxal phosphate-dependent enzyme [Wenxinia marina]KIQ70366.1 Aspartate/tyrosine/aromatic aminotransferase [Wenxinia marina DSM 24838]GGL53718.1 aminotransferase [Wenxinia marina]